jgi:hypothetical protein
MFLALAPVSDMLLTCIVAMAAPIWCDSSHFESNLYCSVLSHKRFALSG